MQPGKLVALTLMSDTFGCDYSLNHPLTLWESFLTLQVLVFHDYNKIIVFNNTCVPWFSWDCGNVPGIWKVLHKWRQCTCHLGSRRSELSAEQGPGLPLCSLLRSSSVAYIILETVLVDVSLRPLSPHLEPMLVHLLRTYFDFWCWAHYPLVLYSMHNMVT